MCGNFGLAGKADSQASKIFLDAAPGSADRSMLKSDSGRPGQSPFLRVMTFNIQVGLETRRRRHYLTRGVGHLLPTRRRSQQLARIAELMSGFDLVGLQEADAGSYRTGGIDLLAYLCERSGHRHHSFLLNRDYGRVAQHGIALAGHLRPTEVVRHALPGRLRGRGVIIAHYGLGVDALVVAVTHLALSRRTRYLQMAWLARRLESARHLIVLGDLNCSMEEILDGPLGSLGIGTMRKESNWAPPPPTFPSWSPRRDIDHIVASRDIGLHRLWIPEGSMSDHLPLAAEMVLPDAVWKAIESAG